MDHQARSREPQRGPSNRRVVDLAGALASFDTRWSPKVVARLNGYEVKVVKIEGEFVWHSHDDTDELFLVLAGELTIQLRDGDVTLRPGQLFVVPRGVEHCPIAAGDGAGGADRTGRCGQHRAGGWPADGGLRRFPRLRADTPQRPSAVRHPRIDRWPAPLHRAARTCLYGQWARL